MIVKPMLAVAAPETIKFPVYASPKLDGIRCLIVKGMAMSRTLKPIPNSYVQDMLSHFVFSGLDGEITVGPANAKNVMQTTSSGIMSFDGTPDFTFHVFDYWTSPEEPFVTRLANLSTWFAMNDRLPFKSVKLLEQTLIHNEEELVQYEQSILTQGYEGVMLRSPDGIYKYGRSTARQGYLLKLKRFNDAEAVVIGFEELLHNENEATIDALGNTKRSSRKEGKVASGLLGSFVVKDIETGVVFSVGSGYTASQRLQFWQERELYIGSILKYKHFKIGAKDAPRFPTFLGFRHPEDM